ncbi:PIR Superfamily Protein [Plasmodium ovale wallikeri]|uniref:PIR Superfamily Protein n=1 Tax=Plasmodium ovale wallikeri TaxID=864142 RepID=A0A1A9AQ31_PLAOA|nr:PIR Superfamily Protein [Plasmodium ovale wallikeri]SBT58342.1 PIR Superfamily Protein [Plasmodium ovale wallikeri]
MINLGAIKSKNTCGIMNYFFNTELKLINRGDILESRFYSSMTGESKKKIKVNNCNFQLYRIQDKEYQKLKTLYELHNNLYNINNSTGDFQQEGICKNICIYRENYAKIFNQNIDKCSVNNQSKFCNELEQFRQKYNHYRNCNTCSGVTLLNHRPPEIKLEKSVDVESHVPNMQGDLHIQESLNYNSNAEKYAIITTTCLTPLGRYLGTRIDRKKFLLNNFDEEDESLLPICERQIIFSENTPYSISYHSV